MSVGDLSQLDHSAVDDDNIGVDFDFGDAQSGGDAGAPVEPKVSEPAANVFANDPPPPTAPAGMSPTFREPPAATPPREFSPSPQAQSRQPAQDFGQVSEDLARTAASFGMAPEHIARYRDNPAALESAINDYNANLLRSNFPQQQFPPQAFAPRPPMAAPYPPQFQPPQAAPQPGWPGAYPTPGMMGPQPPQQPLTGPAGMQFQLWKDQAERDQFDPEFAAKLEGMHDFYAQNLAAMQAQLQQVTGFTQAQVAEQQQRAFQQQAFQDSANFDHMLESLGPDYEVVFGKGTQQTVDRNSLYFANRSRVHAAFSELRQRYAAQGLNPDPRTLLTSAASIVLGPQWNYIDSQARANRASQRSVARPNRGVNAREPGEAAAQAWINQFMASRGVNITPEIESEDDSIGLL